MVQKIGLIDGTLIKRFAGRQKCLISQLKVLDLCDGIIAARHPTLFGTLLLQPGREAKAKIHTQIR